MDERLHCAEYEHSVASVQTEVKPMKYDLWLLSAYLGPEGVASRWSRHMWRFDSTKHALVVGLPGGVHEPGSASVFGRSGGSWRARRAITASDSTPGDSFGFQVGMHDDVIVVTAPLAARSAGAAYVYRWDGHSWCEEQKLLPPDPRKDGFFGGSVDIRKEVIAVGAGHLGARGAVYVFERQGPFWKATQKLQSENGSAGDDFGYSVGMEDDEIVVGAPLAYGGGVAYVYSLRGGSWMQTQRLASLQDGGVDFGRHVAHALGEQTLIVGGSRLDEDGTKRSIAHLFHRSTGRWQPLGILAPNRMR
ncbi:MAG: FG-GAP repeat protein [Polyangiales bacterium]